MRHGTRSDEAAHIPLFTQPRDTSLTFRANLRNLSTTIVANINVFHTVQVCDVLRGFQCMWNTCATNYLKKGHYELSKATSLNFSVSFA